MPRRFLGLLVLCVLAVGLIYTRPAWAESNNLTNVTVRVSPLSLLLENNVIIKVGDFTCQVVYGDDPSSVCANLPPGDYEVSALSAGYIVSPATYTLTVPGENADEENQDEENEDEGDSPDAVAADSDFYFRLYQIRNELFMPTVQVKR
jgi:hypothetical protein